MFLNINCLQFMFRNVHFLILLVENKSSRSLLTSNCFGNFRNSLTFSFFFLYFPDWKWNSVILLAAHPASFAHTFVSGMLLFQWVPWCNSIENLSLKTVFWTHKFAGGTHWNGKQRVPGLINPKLYMNNWKFPDFSLNLENFSWP